MPIHFDMDCFSTAASNFNSSFKSSLINIDTSVSKTKSFVVIMLKCIIIHKWLETSHMLITAGITLNYYQK